ncbi:MAG: hypothetical protein JW863_18800 [Chitinispirillaceae bacterium]|nr:hypothetical protein [Chitinispirillaceae bacterium]
MWNRIAVNELHSAGMKFDYYEVTILSKDLPQKINSGIISNSDFIWFFNPFPDAADNWRNPQATASVKNSAGTIFYQNNNSKDDYRFIPGSNQST